MVRQEPLGGSGPNSIPLCRHVVSKLEQREADPFVPTDGVSASQCFESKGRDGVGAELHRSSKNR